MTAVNVNLDCRNSINTDPANGYKNAPSSINTTYSFRYTGGTNGDGSVVEYTDDGSGQGTISVTVGGDPRYIIDSISFTGDTHGDLSWVHGTSTNNAVITDTNVDNETAYYGVTVRDTVANCTFVCDPPITNKPKPS